MRPASETSAEILFHKICMCSRLLSARGAVSGTHNHSGIHSLRTWRTRTPGPACFAEGRCHWYCRTILRILPVPVAGHSRHPCMVESTLGYWEPASADWRICTTSFELRRRTGDGRLRRRACSAMGLPLSLGQPPIANRPGSTRNLGRSYGWFGCRDHRWPALSRRTCRRFLATWAG
jgi:hypothetical protein